MWLLTPSNLKSFHRFVVRLSLLMSLLMLTNNAMLQADDAVGLKAGDRIVFLGDSITQAGAGPGGYVTLVKEALAKNHADLNLEVIGAGISGNRVPNLEARLEKDVLSKKPSIVVIYIGINDVWHSKNGKGTSKEDYEQGLKRIIKQIQARGARVILATPSMIGEKHDGSNEFDMMLEEYAAISREVAKQNHLQLLDLRKLFVDYLKAHNADQKEKGVLTSDGVHLNPAGNQFVAAAALAALTGQPAGEKVFRHVVLFKFKADVTPEQVAEVVQAFAALPGKIDTIVGFEHGTDVSVEQKAQGFTHAFMVTFKDAAGRDTYLPHPAHQEFVKLVGPRIENVLVFDFVAE
jgi:lysophospholipase L1-like esterase